jgi:ABC-type transporter Mla MlaB component
VIAFPAGARSAPAERPAFQWDATRGPGTLTLRLFGRLGARELDRVAETIARTARSPRDLVLVDLSEVRHIDYRAISGFAAALLLQHERGACVWLLGMSEYVRSLFGVAGAGMVLGRLEWNPGGESEPRRFFPFERDRHASATGPSRERV